MRSEEALRGDLRATGARVLDLTRSYIHPGYRLCVSRQPRVAPTGRFLLFRLVPRRGSGYRTFWARWDNAALRGKPGPPVKIELQHGRKRERDRFRQGKSGYSGHWAREVPPGGTFEVRVVDRGTLIFEGQLSLALTLRWDAQITSPTRVVLEAYEDGRKIAEVAADLLLPVLLEAANLPRRRDGEPSHLAFRRFLDESGEKTIRSLMATVDVPQLPDDVIKRAATLLRLHGAERAASYLRRQIRRSAQAESKD